MTRALGESGSSQKCELIFLFPITQTFRILKLRRRCQKIEHHASNGDILHSDPG